MIGLDASADMVFRARENYDDVQLARMEDPLPEGPWDLVSASSRPPPAQRAEEEPLPPGPQQARSFVIGDVVKADEQVTPIDEDYDFPEQAADLAEWCGGEVAWEADDLAVVRASTRPTRYHSATHGRPEEENFQRPPRQAARAAQGRKAEPQPLPALPQPAAAASGLPDLRHLRRARGRRAADRRPDGASRRTSSRGAGRAVTVALDGYGAEQGFDVLAEGARLAAADGIGVRVFGPQRALGLSGVDGRRGSRHHRVRSPTTRTRSPRSGRRRRPRSSAPPPTSPRATPRRWSAAGSTGATMAAATFGLRRLKGVQRPALAVQVPVPGKPVLFLDVGANVEVRAQHLVQFAFLGAAFSAAVLDVARPRSAC